MSDICMFHNYDGALHKKPLHILFYQIFIISYIPMKVRNN